LRYFNPIGADPKMRSGIHVAKPTHVVGKLVDAEMGRIPAFEITGVDWETRDGTGIRDYIHVWDLAQAHVSALADFDAAFARAGEGAGNYLVINLGTGRGVTVREMVAAFEQVVGHPINKVEKPSRPGDVAGAYANADTARRLLNWEAKLPTTQGIADALRWGELRTRILHL